MVPLRRDRDVGEDIELQGTVEVGGAKGSNLTLYRAQTHAGCGLVPEDAARGGGRGCCDHPPLVTKEGNRRGAGDLDVVRFRKGAGPFAPQVGLAISVSQGPGGVEGGSNLVALDVHADKAVGVKSHAGKLLDIS